MQERADSYRALAAELDDRDRRVAEQIEEVTVLATRAGDVRGRVVSTRDELAALPAARDAAEDARSRAGAADRQAQRDLVEAEAALARAEGGRRVSADELARARSAALEARQTAADAAARVARADAEQIALVETEQVLRAQADGLAVEARTIAAALASAPRVADAALVTPGETLDELDDWGARARAALFVARGTLELERDRIVAEAAALGLAVLGEDLGPSGVALVRRRVEEALA